MARRDRPMFIHEGPSTNDEDLQREARAHLATSPHLQIAAEVLGKLRSLDLDWWTPEQSRETWPAETRMRWLEARADLRQAITTKLTGLPVNTARRKAPDFQASLLDAVLDSGDVPVVQFEMAFEPTDMAIYGSAEEIWTLFRERMPWEDESPAHQRLTAWLLRTLLADKSHIDSIPRKPIITAWELRSAIDPTLWQVRIPIELRAAIDEARLRQERARSKEPFTTKQELAIVTPDHVAAHIPLPELAAVFDIAERNMGLGAPQPEDVMPPELMNGSNVLVLSSHARSDLAPPSGASQTPRPPSRVIARAG